jgi:serine/threonine-protein kinase HipA
MAKTLDVYLYSEFVGHLNQDNGGQMTFQYAESWLDRSWASPLSQSLPLRKERFSRNECRGYFGGILPEESKREIIARNLGISARNDYAMLEQIGGECAGAVTFVPAGEPLPESDYRYRTLSSEELAAVLRELPKRPLLAGEEGIRLSLAGAQDKVAVRVDGDEISLPLGGAPSTHILKPGGDRFEGVVANEALCMKLAAAIGIPSAKVEARTVEGMNYLLVERYDRIYRADSEQGPILERLHQEDFCQALGIVSEMKYQKEGGPSLKQCFALLREVSSTPIIDLSRLLDAVIFNYLVGNNDAHGKNFSLLYRGIGTGDMQVSLSPLYDSLSTVYYPEISRTMAMKLGGEYLSEKVMPRNFEQFAEEAGLAKPMVRRRVTEVIEKILSALTALAHVDATTDEIARLIEVRCDQATRLLRG